MSDLPTSAISSVKKNSGEYFYLYVPPEIAQRLNLKNKSRVMWNLSGSIANLIPFPEGEVQRQVYLLQKQQKQKNIAKERPILEL